MRHSTKTRHRHLEVEGLNLRYREAGTPSSNAVILLHGAPSSSYSFREILPRLGQHAYVIAPDLPGFGFSDAPHLEEGDCIYERLARVITMLVERLGVQRYVLYVTDYSTPAGYLMAMRHPERVLGLVVQNGNTHEEGLHAAWESARRYWAEPTRENEAALPDWLTFDGTRETYLAGLPERIAKLHAEETWHLDWERLTQEGRTALYFRYFYDYRNHVARFDEIAEYHARHQPPCLVLWGRHDPAFDITEVVAYHRALARCEAHIYDGGHFLLESHAAEVTDVLIPFVEGVIAEASATV